MFDRARSAAVASLAAIRDRRRSRNRRAPRPVLSRRPARRRRRREEKDARAVRARSVFVAPATLRPSTARPTAGGSLEHAPLLGRVTRATSASRNGVSSVSDAEEGESDASDASIPSFRRFRRFQRASVAAAARAAAHDGRRTERRTDPDPRIRTRGRSAGHASFPRVPSRRRGTRGLGPFRRRRKKLDDARRRPRPSRMTRANANETPPRRFLGQGRAAFKQVQASIPRRFARRRRACSCCRRSAGRGWFATFCSADVHSGALQRRHEGSRRAAELPLLQHRGEEVRLPSRHVRRRVRRRGATCLPPVRRRNPRGARARPRAPPRGRPWGAAAGPRPGTAGPVAVGRLPRPSRNESVSEATSNLAAGTNPAWRDIAALHVRGLACLSISGVTRCVSDASSERKKGRVRGNTVARVPGTARTLRIRFGGYWYASDELFLRRERDALKVTHFSGSNTLVKSSGSQSSAPTDIPNDFILRSQHVQGRREEMLVEEDTELSSSKHPVDHL